MYLEVGGSTLVRFGGDLYTCDGRDMDKLGEVTPARMLSQCASYSKMADGVALGYRAPMIHIAGRGDIIKFIDPAYRGRKKYGATQDRDRETGPDFVLRNKPQMTLAQNAYMGAI